MRLVVLVFNDMTADVKTAREAAAAAAAGHDVRVLALGGQGLPSTEERDGYVIERIAAHSDAPITRPVAKLRQSRTRTALFASRTAQLRPDVIHAHNVDTLIAGVRVRSRQGARVVWGADELFPEMLVANRPNVPRPVLQYWRMMEKRLSQQTDAVVSVGEMLAHELSGRYAVQPIVVRNVPVLQPLGDRTRLRKRIGLGDEGVVLLYQGLVNIGRGLERVIDLLPTVPKVHFVIQGSGPTLDAVLAHGGSSSAADRFHYIGHAPTEELNDWASGADIGDLLLENASLNNYYAAPNKLFQYMMAGIPVLASDFPEMSKVIAQGPTGVAVDPASPDRVRDALRELADDSARRLQMGQAARRLAETRYNWDIEKQKLLEVYDRLAAASTS